MMGQYHTVKGVEIIAIYRVQSVPTWIPEEYATEDK